MIISPLEVGIIETDPTVHFTGALAQNALATATLSFPTNWSTSGVYQCSIEAITIESAQNLDWDIFIWSSSNFNNTDYRLDKFITFVNYVTTSGKQIAGANQFYYPSPNTNMRIPYLDEGHTGQLYIGLVNRNAVSKNAGATGYIKLRFICRPVVGG